MTFQIELTDYPTNCRICKCRLFLLVPQDTCDTCYAVMWPEERNTYNKSLNPFPADNFDPWDVSK